MLKDSNSFFIYPLFILTIIKTYYLPIISGAVLHAKDLLNKGSITSTRVSHSNEKQMYYTIL